MKALTSERYTFSLWLLLPALVTIILGNFMAILDTTIVNVALPTLGRVFSADLGLLQWVISGYMLSQAAVVPLAGWLCDRHGSRRIYLGALALFTAGSVLCALALTGPMLVAARVVQGVGGGMLIPIGMALVFGMAPPEKRGTVMTVFGIPMLLGPTLGPVLSGWLLQYADWRLIFLINLPVGLFTILVGLRALPKAPAQHRAGPLDVPGMILGPLAFGALTYGISESATATWTGPTTLAGLGVGIVALIIFVLRELNARHPLLELRIFRSPDLSRGVLTQWVLFGGLFGTMFCLPLFLQQIRNYSTLETGFFLLPGAIASGIMMQVGGRLFDRVGLKGPAVFGLILVTSAMWLYSQISSKTTGLDLLLPQVLQGTGMGLVGMPLNAYVLSCAPRQILSRVTSLLAACQNLVGSLAIAGYATFLQSRIADYSAQAAAGSTSADPGLAFGDVYRIAMVAVIVCFALMMTLRRHPRNEDSGLSTVSFDEVEIDSYSMPGA